MRSFLKLLLGASFMLAPLLSAHAEVEVVESSSTQTVRQTQSQQKAQQVNAELFMQLQQLQEEVMQMRGLLEEQQFQISQLKQQRLDDYVNLDKRISDLTRQLSGESVDSASTSVASTASTSTQSSSIPASSPLLAEKAKDKEAYNAAYALIQKRKFEDAKEAFLNLINDYPDSSYVANAYYWLGEIYIIDADYEKAKSAFKTVIDQYPDHGKNPESLYKLATVNYEMGDRETAKQQLKSVIDRYSDTSVNIVRKARSFLEKHYL